MSFSWLDLIIPVANAPGLDDERVDNRDIDSCVAVCGNIDVVLPVVQDGESDIEVEYVEDITISDFSVYSVAGVKRDYFGYEFDEEEKKSNALIDARNNIVTKIWRFKKISGDGKRYDGGYITPDPLPLPITLIHHPPVPYRNNEKWYEEIAISNSTEIREVAKKNEEFDVSVDIRVPLIPGVYRREFRLNDKLGKRIKINNIKSGKVFVVFRVVPHEVLSPVSGEISVGNIATPIDTESYAQDNVMYFCNWGLIYFDRKGELIAKEKKPSAYTHQTRDRFAWDVNAKNNTDSAKCVYSISKGKVLYINKNYGAVWILHDYVEGEENDTGYIAVYMHMLEESWGDKSISRKIWSEGVSVEIGTVLGKIGGRGVKDKLQSDDVFPRHLHFAIYPLPEKQGHGGDFNFFKGLESVHAGILKTDYELKDKDLNL